ncbi:MAG: type I glyceraldehyde-3-phosphate dehydrogenase [Lactobacillus sp.]|jgi:glyceraldehyde 3-phosphate dehydrogenase|uniref:Glyceraldehyde-3-phosphate dehydrogenase n=1 Tax=Bombilactobacillus bombi TaxID=1303590 RepID=A0A347SRW0_9LACO|nr:type I glyceraldehyde-3-phosphate dehydrogenase [Bombilactobacillus bombi]MCO6542015.1 type I glyceraldehyde-3-phosphate dehydrogenase [Lactobacillus sp.]AXX64769.1 type I glyceraldehyde-3-phosphate dehydrogenase [Bombilactobacillus bombi]MCO6542658.1 type I glyceraldehyde-3-phosphate dehydrogenase [Lactobacillus sp.]RHW47334.1 type I glyceraldehyde-3-phosphate dehydrogenase [Bombilactobacillus bombi]RHW50095.1 type I glyceraldehyde-3-phosphate dehydrogenase [Bombilactobacillus bombi]
MATKVGINGFGRIGRLALRRIYEVANDDLEVVAINDLTSPAMLAHLLKYDTAHGIFKHEISSTDNAIVIDGKKIPVYAESDARNIPWVKNDGVELVLESTGFYTSKEKAQAHIDAGAKKVLISAPAGDLKTVVYGVNDDTITKDDQIISAASCTTNCLAPLAKAVNDAFGIKVGTMTTIHAYTATQKLQDGPDRKGNKRAARAAAQNTIPHSTGAAKAIGMVIPELKGKLDGHAQRVPVITGSLTEMDAILDKKVTAEEVNAAVKKVTDGSESFGYNDDEIVSSDIIGTEFGSVFDPTQTQVVTAGDAQIVKTVAWYDNESGFTAQMIRTLQKFASLL